MKARAGFLSLSLLLAGCSNAVDDPGDGPGTDGCAPVPVRSALAQTGDTRDVHDPALIRHGDRYYLFSTGHGVPVRQSADLVHWTSAGQVFARMPDWASAAVPGLEFPWAPDVAFFGGRYHLYYSLSTFGSQQSAIGLATNATLDPADPAYAWEDQGQVVASTPVASDFNAIDPNVAFDAAGQPWLSWGSFWGGIRMRRLDPSTGLLSAADPAVYALAARPVERAVEAPFIVRHGGYYYLFVSFDACCRGAASTYRIVVGRSEQITGPYADRAGVAMTQGGGTAVLSGYGRIAGPGHNAVVADGGRHYLVHHFYDTDAAGVPRLQVRSLLWDADGWPLAGEPYDGMPPAPSPGAAPDVTGAWAHAAGAGPAEPIRLEPGGRIERCNGDGTWSQDGPALVLRLGTGPSVTAVAAGDGTWYTGRTADGRLVRGWRVDDG